MMNQNLNGHNGDYLKRQAKKIAKQQNIPHYQALEKVAIEAGFNNWNHFVNVNKEKISVKQNEKTENIEIKPLKTLVKRQKKVNPYRNLLVAGINELLKNNLISLESQTNTLSNKKDGHFEVTLFGFPSVVLWQDIGFEELRISVWWKYDHSLHPQANLKGNTRENFNCSSPLAKRQHYKNFVGVTATVWLERKTGKYIQGKGNKSILDIYTRKGEKAELDKLPVQNPKGFQIEGKFHF